MFVLILTCEVLLLAPGGKTVYLGSTEGVLSYFEEAGYEV